jgi:hypothetical protein
MPELRGYPKREKRKRASKRKVVEYDNSEPEMCKNCTHFKPKLYVVGGEQFPPVCKKHEFEVDIQAICNDWKDPD